MSKKRDPQPQQMVPPDSTDAVAPVMAAAQDAPEVVITSKPVAMTVPPLPAPVNKLTDVDRMTLELAKQRRQTALAEAKTALAQSENAELAFKYVVLQLYMKYSLTDADAVSETGDIIRGGALPKPPQA